MTSSKPDDLSRTPPPNTITLRIRASTYGIWAGTQTFSPGDLFTALPPGDVKLNIPTPF